MLMSRRQNASQNHNLKITDKSFANAAKFGTIPRNQNCIHEDIKSRLNPGNAWYYEVQNHLSSIGFEVLTAVVMKSFIF
jgi:hypothetical protein